MFHERVESAKWNILAVPFHGHRTRRLVVGIAELAQFLLERHILFPEDLPIRACSPQYSFEFLRRIAGIEQLANQHIRDLAALGHDFARESQVTSFFIAVLTVATYFNVRHR